MNFKRFILSSRVTGAVLKVITCVAFSLAAFGNAYFTIVDVTHRIGSPWKTIFILVFGLAMSALMLLFAYGAAKTTVDDFLREARIFLRLGFRKSRLLSAEEYERLRKIEESSEIEIRERTQNKI
ncbi:MAG: hypothetical protein K0M66_09905 [Thiobacillus sp.]|nr:hypothetical protein [Thiobacillus sp.]